MTQIRLKIRKRTYELVGRRLYWRIGEVVTIQDGPQAGQERLEDKAYLQSMEGVARHLLERSLRTSDAKTLMELVHLSKAIREEVRDALYEA